MSAAPELAQPKERPILFSAPMILAILAGKKTQTRRLVRIDDRPVLLKSSKDHRHQRGIPSDAQNVRMCSHYVKCDAPEGSNTVSCRVDSPYGSMGERLWVRETWGLYHEHAKTLSDKSQLDDAKRGVPWAHVHYRATDDQWADVPKWRPSIFMPRWAGRITLEVTGVHVERLQEITEEDAKAEGVDRVRVWEDGDDAGDAINGHGYAPPLSSRVGAFELLWNGINGKRASWASNPWVWVLAFKRVPSCRFADPAFDEGGVL